MRLTDYCLQHAHIQLGNDKKTDFWHAGWIHRRRPKDIAPLFSPKQKRKSDLLQKPYIITIGFVI